MIVVLVLAVYGAVASALSAAAHGVAHGVLWVVDRDTFRYGACCDCGLARQTRANERRQAATGRYYRA